MHSTVGTRPPAAEASGRVLIAKLKAVLSKELGRKSSRGKGGDIEATISKLSRGEQVLTIAQGCEEGRRLSLSWVLKLQGHLAGSSDQHLACPQGLRSV